MLPTDGSQYIGFYPTFVVISIILDIEPSLSLSPNPTNADELTHVTCTWKDGEISDAKLEMNGTVITKLE